MWIRQTRMAIAPDARNRTGDLRFIKIQSHRIHPKTADLNKREDDTNTNNDLSISDDEMTNIIRTHKSPTNMWRVPRNNDLQDIPEFAWKLYGEFASLYLNQNVLCGRIEPVGGSLPYLQQRVPPSLVDQVRTFLHIASTGGHLCTAKLFKKVKQRVWWPVFKDDDQLFVKVAWKAQPCSNVPPLIG